VSLGARYVCGFGSFDFRNYGDSAIEQRRCLAFENADVGVEARFEPPQAAVQIERIGTTKRCRIGSSEAVISMGMVMMSKRELTQPCSHRTSLPSTPGTGISLAETGARKGHSSLTETESETRRMPEKPYSGAISASRPAGVRPLKTVWARARDPMIKSPNDLRPINGIHANRGDKAALTTLRYYRQCKPDFQPLLGSRPGFIPDYPIHWCALWTMPPPSEFAGPPGTGPSHQSSGFPSYHDQIFFNF
jgi:hypothetical protein